ncbi:Dihydrodipicolinate synthetase [uncultured Pleomorphomonas sp.]|uniref:Dihydrodipicolinate synthetase n=2 Tax=uncultured Pleomorphomonas sp. TaxID=442121 RepID=A0A212LG24_9HYPH|nr:Dihydrodipicolinate synthetase [uncultured Pleomorphomonas sp.]
MKMTARDKYHGVWPVMLTPFDDRNEIDWSSLGKLIDWYIKSGVSGLFAACQSSEMFFLSDAETLKLVRFVVDRADGRVPVVASGHTAAVLSQQIDQLAAVAETGVDSVIFISNRFASPSEADPVMQERLAILSDALPRSVGLGVYECPYPYKRLLSDETVRWCAESGRFTFVKDTCCNIERIRRRAEIANGSRLNIANANAQTLLDSLRAGAAGYSGVMANFHPDLYVWLCDNWQSEPEKAEKLSLYLSTAALVESLDYPVCAKDYQVAIGNFATTNCRARETGGYFRDHFRSNMRQAMKLGDEYRRMIGL